MAEADNGYANPALLWSPEHLQEHLGSPGIAVIDTRPAELFAAGHIPGARHFDPYFVNCDDTDPGPLASFTRMWGNLLGWRGVARTDRIVFYGAFSDMCAARGFWFAEYLGVEQVHVLNGGFGAWEAAGLPVSRDSAPASPVKFVAEERPERVATYSSILAAMADPTCVIVDTRSPAEFAGTDVRARHGGAIPSAVHRDWVDLYDAATGRMHSAETLGRAFTEIGVTPDKDVTLYCNTGYRSAHGYLALRLLGYPRLRNYVGSWQEWGNRPGLPITKP